MDRLTFLLVCLFTRTLCELVVFTKQNDTIFSGHVLLSVPMPMWSLCAQFCSRVQVCQSINFIAWNKTCKCGLIESAGNSFVAASTFPKQLSGQCKGNYCKRNEACMPKGLNYYCVPLSNIFPECGTKLRPRDCSDLPVGSASGVYTIYPTNAIFDVYCEMDTAGFGWTVFQSRMNGSTDFYRGWIDYENGFGSLTSEFWLGNKFIHLLTSTGDYKLYVHLEDFEGKSAYAEYSGFSLGGTATDHTLNVGGYCGTAGDSLVSNDERTQNGMMFSSYDKDNDRSPKSCELQYKGAWWYSWCHRSNLNGQYLGGKHLSTADGINWATWRGVRYSLKSTKMMIKLH